jgi:L-lactate dehydrogenase complex protein LldG
MEESTSREKILKKIRNALLEKADNPFSRTVFDAPVHTPVGEDIDLVFAESFTRIGGKFIYCENEAEGVQSLAALAAELKATAVLCREEPLLQKLKQAGLEVSGDFDAAQDQSIGLTSCEALIARSGTILLSSRQGGGRKMNVFPDIHIVYGRTSQLCAEVTDGLDKVREKYGVRLPSLLTLASGPSRTADIEKTLVMGAHGPRELYLILQEDLI